ncbi:MAG: low specificity L-threonine aldolase [Pseudomonadota bacterium]
MKGFASDNISGVHPVVIDAMIRANTGHARPYGDDPDTMRVRAMFEHIFGPGCDTYFVFNGTAANTLSLAAMTRPFNSIVCSDSAHIHVDECGAPEKFTGCKLIPVSAPRGILEPESIAPLLAHLGFEHHSQPSVISITQPTELGAVYLPEQVLALTRFAHDHGMLVHMDGARLANAAAFLNAGLREITRDLGVDVLSFGGTKNGAMFGEAVLFFRPGLSDTFKYIRKQGMHLGSKMRFIAVQFEALLTRDLWRNNANHSNAMAALLGRLITPVPGIILSGPVETNAVFARIPAPWITALQEHVFFYTWNHETSEVRFMTSFDTSPREVEEFASLIRDISMINPA